MTKTELAQQVEDLMDSYHDGVMPHSEFETKLALLAHEFIYHELLRLDFFFPTRGVEQ